MRERDPANAGYLTSVNTPFSVWVVVFLALALANLPFLTLRGLGVIPLQKPKTLGLRALELLVCYLLAGLAGLAFERRAGEIAPQTWEFYAITVFLFLTFAFPGFVYRYLVMRNR